MSTEEFMAEVAVAMFDIHEVEAEVPRHNGCAMEFFNDGFDFRVGEHGKISGQFQPPVEKRMVVENARLGTAVGIGAAVAARICELQTYQQPVVRAGCLAVFFDQDGAQPRQPCAGVVGSDELIGIGASFMRDGDSLRLKRRGPAVQSREPLGRTGAICRYFRNTPPTGGHPD